MTFGKITITTLGPHLNSNYKSKKIKLKYLSKEMTT